MKRRPPALAPDGSLAVQTRYGAWTTVPCAAPYRHGSTLVACGFPLYQVDVDGPRSGRDLKRCRDCGWWNVVIWDGWNCSVRASETRPEYGTDVAGTDTR